MTATVNFQIVIPRRSLTCSGCSERFQPSDAYYSRITEDEVEGFVRQDQCTACAKAETSDSPTSAIQWKGKVPAKKQVDPYADLSRDERVFAILREVLASDEEGAPAEAFILALYLGRRRQLLFRKRVVKEGRAFQLYEVSKTEEILVVPHLELSALEVEAVQKRVAAKMRGEKSQRSGGSDSGTEEQHSQL